MIFGDLALQEAERAFPGEDGRRRVKGRCRGNRNTGCEEVRYGFYKWSVR